VASTYDHVEVLFGGPDLMVWNSKIGGGRDGNDPSVDIAKDADQRF